MKHFAELSPDLYAPIVDRLYRYRSVGWVGRQLPRIGETSAEVMRGLHRARAASQGRFIALRDHHCPLCDHEEPGDAFSIEHGGVRYVLPTLVVHVIEAHAYRMPDEVEAALLAPAHAQIRLLAAFERAQPTSMTAACAASLPDEAHASVAMYADIGGVCVLTPSGEFAVYSHYRDRERCAMREWSIQAAWSALRARFPGLAARPDLMALRERAGPAAEHPAPDANLVRARHAASDPIWLAHRYGPAADPSAGIVERAVWRPAHGVWAYDVTLADGTQASRVAWTRIRARETG